jgi:DNA-binding GntR family transcriptional regulator
LEVTVARTTLVEKVRDDLAAEMGTRFPLGAKLPNEQELADRFRVSRATIREAVRGLVEAGLVARVHGSGTYVTGTRKARHSLDTTMSYTAMIEAAGLKPEVEILGISVRPADAEETARLGLPDGAEVLAVERVRTADGRAVVYSQDRLPADLLPAEAIEGPSLYRVLESVGIVVRTASARLVPVVADRHLGSVLHVPAGTPLLHIDQTDVDQTGRPVMVSAEWHVSDVFELRINRRREGP